MTTDTIFVFKEANYDEDADTWEDVQVYKDSDNDTDLYFSPGLTHVTEEDLAVLLDWLIAKNKAK